MLLASQILFSLVQSFENREKVTRQGREQHAETEDIETLFCIRDGFFFIFIFIL